MPGTAIAAEPIVRGTRCRLPSSGSRGFGVAAITESHQTMILYSRPARTRVLSSSCADCGHGVGGNQVSYKGSRHAADTHAATDGHFHGRARVTCGSSRHVLASKVDQ